MDGFKTLFDGLAANLPIAMLAIALIAIGWLVRMLVSSYDARAKELQAVNAAHDAAIEAAHAAHLETAMMAAPLASKLADCVAAAERLSARVIGGQ